MNPKEKHSAGGGDFKLNHEHAKAGYANAQDAVRFVDSKTGVLTGLVTLTTGIPFALLQWFLSKDNPVTPLVAQLFQLHPVMTGISVFVFIMGLIFGALSILSAMGGLMARQPHTPKNGKAHFHCHLWDFLVGKILGHKRKTTSHPITTLFPFYPPERLEEARIIFGNISAGGYSEEKILKEYTVQIESIGAVLAAKINKNQDAVHWFELQVLTYILSVIWIFITAMHPVYLHYKHQHPEIPRSEKSLFTTPALQMNKPNDKP